MAAKLFKITKDTPWNDKVPRHENCFQWPLVNPQSCPGAQCEFSITELHPLVGRAFDDAHADEDHVFYGLSGRAEVVVDGEHYFIEPGDALWVSKGSVHSFTPLGGESFRYAVVLAPGRAFWTQQT
jgi:mannose-6-phosphate isomerase-like protein (cupin superfamily)